MILHATVFMPETFQTTEAGPQTGPPLNGKTLGIFGITKINDTHLTELIVRKHLYQDLFSH